jgi:hypothetical protein
LGHPFRVVKKKAFSMGVSQVLDFVAVLVGDVGRQRPLRGEEVLGVLLTLLPELVERRGHSASVA